MKITKGQLKRIIAEEHALVYGKPSRKMSRKALQERKKFLENKKQAQAEYIARMMVETQKAYSSRPKRLNEGFFSQVMKAIGGAAGEAFKQGGKAVSSITGPAQKAYQDIKKAAQDSMKAEKDKNIKSAQETVAKSMDKSAAEMFEDFLAQAYEPLVKAGMDQQAAAAFVNPLATGAVASAASDEKWLKSIESMESGDSEESGNEDESTDEK